MAIITLLTDFGIEDEYVGVMKGVILSINPGATIVDITHHIPPQQIVQAAFTLEAAFRFFPKGSVHVVVVDPGVGGDRAIVALESGGHRFLAPDNGVLTRLLVEPVQAVVRVENQDYFLPHVSRTFHGRDIFSPVAAHLSLGVPLSKMGPPLVSETLQTLPVEKTASRLKNEISGTIISIDRFGNLITNVRAVDCEALGGNGALCVQVGGTVVKGLSEAYEHTPPGQPLVIVGSRGTLEIAVNQGSAVAFFKSRTGDTVKINRTG